MSITVITTHIPRNERVTRHVEPLEETCVGLLQAERVWGVSSRTAGIAGAALRYDPGRDGLRFPLSSNARG